MKPVQKASSPKIIESDTNDTYSIFTNESSPTGDSYVVSISQEYLDEMKKSSKKKIPVNITLKESGQSTQHKINYSDILQSMDDENENVRSYYEKDDYQRFCDNMAAKLRRLPLDRAMLVQVEIQSIVAKERIKMYQKVHSVMDGIP